MVRKHAMFHAGVVRELGIAVASWGCMVRSVIILALAGALAGCGGNPGGNPPPDAGTLTLTVTPTSPATAPLTLQQARLELDNVSLVGDVAPVSMLSDVSIDLLSSGMTLPFTMLPQGLYSRVRFTVDTVSMQGTWRGVPLTIHLESGDGSQSTVIDLRSSTGVEVAPGHDATIAVGIDAASWLAGGLLDSATQSSGQIVLDSSNNVALGQQLLSRLAPSFSWQGAPVQ